MEQSTLREWQYTQLQNNIKSFESLLSIIDPAALTTYRDGGTGWTALEVLCHLRDFEQVFIDRVHVNVEQEGGTVPFPNPDALAAEREYNQQDPAAVIAEWKRRRAALLAYLRALPEDHWPRTAVHPVRGPMTVGDHLQLATMHDTIHLEQLTRTLREKLTSA